VQEGTEVAGVGGDDGIFGEVLVDLTDDGGEVDAVGGGVPGLFQKGQVDLMQVVDPAAALAGVGRGFQGEKGFHHLVGVAGHAEVGTPDAADLVGVGPDVDQRQLRLRGGGETVG